jgi:N-acetylmuramoyl-L-alanine amidase
MRAIKYIVVHCTDTLPTAEIKNIQKYWKEKLGWERPGYHYIIKADGETVNLLQEDKVSNGVLGFNTGCINIAYIGGRTKEGKSADTKTRAQEHALFDKIVDLTEKYPGAQVRGHYEFPNQGGRTCPNFNVKNWLRDYEPDLNK